MDGPLRVFSVKKGVSCVLYVLNISCVGEGKDKLSGHPCEENRSRRIVCLDQMSLGGSRRARRNKTWKMRRSSGQIIYFAGRIGG